MSRLRINRRQLLGAAASTAVAGLVLARGMPARGEVSASTSLDERKEPVAAWLDGMLSGDERAQARATLAPLQPRLLELDLLWQWRRELAQEAGKGVRTVAITRWDKAILLKGLAREAALPVRQQRIAHSLFRTEIG